MLGINLKLHSINFLSNIVEPSDTLRISITTLPDKQKEAKVFPVKNINMENISFNVKFNEEIEKILIVFRRKSLFSDGPIIASTCINAKDIGIFKDNSSEFHMKINLYESINHMPEKDNIKSIKARKTIGNMEIDFTVKEDYAVQTYGISLDKIEQRTLRRKLNNFTSLRSKENQYIFN